MGRPPVGDKGREGWVSFVHTAAPGRSLGLGPADEPFEHGLFLGKAAFDEAPFAVAQIGDQLLAVARDVLPE